MPKSESKNVNGFTLNFCFIALAVMILSGGCSKPSQPPIVASEPRLTGSSSDVPVEIRFNWQIGGRYVMRMEMKQQSDFRRGGTEGGRGGQLSLAHEYAIGVTNDPVTGLHGLDLELLSIEMEESAGDRMFLNYDSQNRVTGTGGNPAAEQLERLIGGHVRYLIDSNNKVIGEAGMNEWTARANTKSKNGGGRSGGNRAGGAVARQTAALESFKQMLALTALPGRLFAVGDNWPVKFESDNSVVGSITIVGTNTFRGWQDRDRKKCARIELSGLATPRRTNAIEQADNRGNRRGMLFNEGSISGVCWIDPAASFPTEVTFEQSFSHSGMVGQQRRQGTNAPPTNSVPQPYTAQSRQTISFKLIDMNLAAAAAGN